MIATIMEHQSPSDNSLYIPRCDRNIKDLKDLGFKIIAGQQIYKKTLDGKR